MISVYADFFIMRFKDNCLLKKKFLEVAHKHNLTLAKAWRVNKSNKKEYEALEGEGGMNRWFI